MANLDLTKAFDSLPYCGVFRSLLGGLVCLKCCVVSVHIHNNTVCVILNIVGTAQMSRGLRQAVPWRPFYLRHGRQASAGVLTAASVKDGLLPTRCQWQNHSTQSLRKAAAQLMDAFEWP